MDSDNFSQRMQRVAADATSQTSIERLLRIATQVCGCVAARVRLGEGPKEVVIAYGLAPSPDAILLPSREAVLYRDGATFGSLQVMGLDGTRTDDVLDQALIDVGALIVEHLEMRRAAELLAESERRVRASTEMFRQVTERAPGAIFVRRGETIVYCNRAFLRLLGHTTFDQVIGHSVLDHVHEDFREHLRARIASGEEPPMLHAPSQGVRRDGRIVPVEISTIRIEFDGEPAVLAILRDLTERKRLEHQLLITERMASVGTLAAGVAHEINNPLSFVLTNVDFARGQLPEGEARTALEEAQKGAERVQRIVASLKTLSTADDDRRGPVDVQQSLELALAMITNEIGQRAKLHRKFRAVPPVLANESRLGQVFLNLIVNAVHAIPAGAPNEHSITIATTHEPTGHVVVEVRDTGVGITPEVLPRIFDPFFTTKPIGLGTGLGLSICHGVITGLGGEIAVESEVGLGTTMRVRLPALATEHKISTSAPPASTVRPTARRARVLVIDDEPMIGSSIRRILAADHDVVVTTNGSEALHLIAQGARYDVILCDLMMPEMTGMEVFEDLSVHMPDQAERMVFLTGGTFTEHARTFVEQRPTRVHHKPFPPAQLRELIARMLCA